MLASRLFALLSRVFAARDPEQPCRRPRHVSRVSLDSGILSLSPQHLTPTLPASPGNLLRTADGRICILDFGLMTEVAPERRLALVEYIAHLSVQDWAGVARDLVGLGFTPEGARSCRIHSPTDEPRRPVPGPCASWLLTSPPEQRFHRAVCRCRGFGARACACDDLHEVRGGHRSLGVTTPVSLLLVGAPDPGEAGLVEPLGAVLTQLSQGGGAKGINIDDVTAQLERLTREYPFQVKQRPSPTFHPPWN